METDVINKTYSELQNDIEEYYILKRQMDEIKQRLAELRENILESYEDGVHIEDRYVVSVKTYKQNRFDTKAFKKNHPDLYSEYLNEREVKKLEVKIRLSAEYKEV